MQRQILRVVLIALGVLIALIGVASAWLFRDGLGPDSVTSHGWVAFWRIASESAPFLAIGTILSVLGVVLPKRAHNHSLKADGADAPRP